MTARPVGAVLVAALFATLVTACSSDPGAPATTSRASSAAATPAAAGAPTTRWWSDPAASSGSAVDPDDPTAAAAHLQRSRHDYCAVLAATVRAGRALVPSTSSNLALTRAFVAEVQRLAPAEVASAWQVLGPAVLSVASGSPQAPVSGAGTSIRSAVVTIAHDAKARCGVTLAG